MKSLAVFVFLFFAFGVMSSCTDDLAEDEKTYEVLATEGDDHEVPETPDGEP